MPIIDINKLGHYLQEELPRDKSLCHVPYLKPPPGERPDLLKEIAENLCGDLARGLPYFLSIVRTKWHMHTERDYIMRRVCDHLEEKISRGDFNGMGGN